MSELLNIVAMFLALLGSSNFVMKKTEKGAWQFMLGNVINMTVGLAIGNLWLFLAQAGLMYFTLNMVKVKVTKRFTLLAILAIVLISILGINTVQVFRNYGAIDITATILAILGAYAMSKAWWHAMALMWIVADIGFLIMAYQESLLGLAIQSLVFIYHGYLRLNDRPIPAIFK